MIQVMCIYPTILERGGYVDRDEIVSITEADTHNPRIQRNFRLPDGRPIEPINLPKAAVEPVEDFTTNNDALAGEMMGLMSLTKDELIRKAQAIGIATSSRMTKEDIARMIAEAGVPPTFAH